MHVTRWNRRLPVIVSMLLSGALACNDCETDERVYEAVRFAVLYPEQFAQYVSDNASRLDQGYLNCSENCARRLDDYIEKELEFCDEAHAGNPDFRNACYDDMDPFIIMRNNVLEVRSIIADKTPFNSTDLHDLLVRQKEANPSAHVRYNGEIIDVMKPYLVCRECHRTLLGIDF